MEVEVFGKKNNIENSLQDSIKAKISLIEIEKEINKSIQLIYKKLVNGGKVILCGNGGSASISNHFLCDL